MAYNRIYLLVGALATAVIVLSIWLYREHQQAPGIDIKVGKGGITVETR